MPPSSPTGGPPRRRHARGDEPRGPAPAHPPRSRGSARRRLGLGLAALLLALASLGLPPLVGAAHAQQAEDAQQAGDAGLRVRTRVVRPPEGSLRRGRFLVPAWAVYAGGALIATAAAGWLAWRLGRRRR